MHIRTSMMIGLLVMMAFSIGCSQKAKTDVTTNADEEVVAAPLEDPKPVPDLVPDEEYSGGLSRSQRETDARAIIALIDRGYAPLEWKTVLLGVDPEAHASAFLAAALAAEDDYAFYAAVGTYLQGLHDSHVSHYIPSTKRALLRFDADDIEGRIIVTKVYEEYVERGLPIAVGDELVAIDGVPAEEVRDELLPFFGEGNARTEIRRATDYLTFRSQERFPNVPEGDVVVSLRSYATGELRDIPLTWEVKGRELATINDPGITLAKAQGVAGGEGVNVYREDDRPKGFLENARLRLAPRWERMRLGNHGEVRPFFDLGESFEVRREEPYFSGVFTMGDKRVGFLRLHTYSSSRSFSADDIFAELAEEIRFFEEEADVLIIDQTGNAGGLYCSIMMKVASFLFDEPFPEIQDRWRANRDTLLWIESDLEDMEDAGDRAILSQLADGIRSAMERGERLTDPFPMCDHDGMIEPYTTADGERIVFTGPVLLLIDELAASCGDYFPAHLKDLGRATLFGATTLGAGGSIKRIDETIGYAEMRLSYTISMGVRTVQVPLADGTTTPYIENMGISPDIPYALTIEDMMNGYTSYRDAALEAALALVE